MAKAVTFWQLLRNNAAFRCNMTATLIILHRNLFLASTISTFGDWFNELAVLSIIMKHASSGFLVAGFFIARELVPVFATPVTGLVGDRFDRRRVMVICDLSRAAVVLLFLLVRSEEMLWLLYPVAALQYLFAAFFIPCMQALLPQFVEESHLVKANSLLNTTWCLLLVLGGAAGGLVNEAFGTDVSFVVDSVSYLASAFFVFRCWNLPLLEWSSSKETARGKAEPKLEEDPGEEEQENPVLVKESRLQAMQKGLSYLRSHPYVAFVTLAKGSGSLYWSAAELDCIEFSELNPMLGSANITLSLTYVCAGLGVLFMTLVLAGWLIPGTVLNSQRWLFFGSLFGFGGTLLMAVVPSTWVYLGAQVFRTMGSSALWVYSASLLQRIVPNNVGARVFALETAVFSALSVVGRLVYSSLLDYTEWGIESEPCSFSNSSGIDLGSLGNSSSADGCVTDWHHRYILLLFTSVPLLTSVFWLLFNVKYNAFAKSYQEDSVSDEAEMGLLQEDPLVDHEGSHTSQEQEN